MIIFERHGNVSFFITIGLTVIHNNLCIYMKKRKNSFNPCKKDAKQKKESGMLLFNGCGAVEVKNINPNSCGLQLRQQTIPEIIASRKRNPYFTDWQKEKILFTNDNTTMTLGELDKIYNN